MSFADHLQNRVENLARQKAARGVNDYPLSMWIGVFSRERQAATYNNILQELGANGVAADAYLVQDDIGNGMQDLGRPRIFIRERANEPTDAARQSIVNRGIGRYAILSSYDASQNEPPVL